MRNALATRRPERRGPPASGFVFADVVCCVMWVLRASCLVRISTDSSWFSPLRMASLNHPCKRRTPGCIRFSRLPDTSVHWPFHQDVGTARTVESRRSTGNTTIGIGSYGCYSIVWFCAEKLALGVAHTSQNTRMPVLYKRPVMLAGVNDRVFSH